MGEISSDWRQKIRETCRQCVDIFDSQQSLKQVFDHPQIYAWQESLPQAIDKDQRVDVTLNYLSDKENALGQSALVLFLQVLSTRYRSPDKLHYLLQDHIRELQAGRPLARGKRMYNALTDAARHSAHFAISEMGLIRDSALSVALIKARRFHQSNVEYEVMGTGWLIAPGLLLTCWHVVATLTDPDETPPETADIQRQLNDMLVFFNQTEHTRGSIDYSVERLEFKGTPEQDFAILRLTNRKYHPYEHFRYLPIEPDPPLTTQTQLFIIQHPWGEPQQVAIGGSYVGRTEVPGRICYTTDTQPGTSGAPVLRRQSGCVVAVHNGKIVDGAVRSEGTHIDTILNTLQVQAPELYREIMHEQGKLNKALAPAPVTKEPVAVVSSTQRQLHAASSPIISPLQSEGLHHQPAPEPDERLLRYIYSATHTSTAPILCLTFDPTGESLLYGAMADGIHRVDIATLRLTSALKTYTKAVTSLALSADGKYAGSGGDDGTIMLWHLAQPSRYKTLQAHTDWVSCLSFSANGHYLLSGSNDGSIRILEISTRSSQILKKSTGIRALTCHPQQDLSASCSLGQQPIVWPITPASNSDPLELTETATCLRFNPTGRYLVGGNAEGALVIYDTQNWNVTSLPTQHTQAIRCLAFHPAGMLMASGGDDQTIQLWDILARKHVQTLPVHTGRITGLAFSPDGHFLASAGHDARLIVWKSL
jgi:hypothetical protein